jgi:DNA-binding NtrC family response regulator
MIETADGLPQVIRVVVVDDELPILRLWKRILHDERFSVSTHASPLEALALLRDGGIDVAITDVRMPEMDGMRFLAEAKAIDPDLEVIVMTGHVEVKRAVDCMRRGAYDFIPKPFENPSALELLVLRAAERRLLARRVKHLEQERGLEGIRGCIGDSPAMRKVLDLVQAVAASDTTILVCGESGTGKELVARAIHENGPRRAKPLLAINCSAFADSLLEEELFGHAKGAFTGADTRKSGLFEAADGGTVFLDEIADMSMPCQAKILRTLQEGEVRPVGSTITLKVNVRIIAATNVDLEARCKEGRFRTDLYHRLNVIRVDVPPLRERADDIPLLVAHFLRQFQEAAGKRLDGIRQSTLERLVRQEWPGNVRELKNAVERAVLLSRPERKLDSSDFPIVRKAADGALPWFDTADPTPPPAAPGGGAGDQPRTWESDDILGLPFSQAKERSVLEFERVYLSRLMKRHPSISSAAEAAGLDRSNFRRLLRRHNLDCTKPAGQPKDHPV